MLFSVIPAKAGIQSFQIVINYLGSGFHRSDDFLRNHQYLTSFVALSGMLYAISKTGRRGNDP